MANKRLIDANALIAQFDDSFKGFVMARIIDEQPTVDAVEVVHGKWMPQYDSAWIDGQRWKTGYYCSSRMGFNKAESHYCPNCGAKMDGGNEDG